VDGRRIEILKNAQDETIKRKEMRLSKIGDS